VALSAGGTTGEVRDGARFERISCTVDLVALIVATSLTALTTRRVLTG